MYRLLENIFLSPHQNYRRSKQPINEIIGIPTLADAKAICIYYYLPNPKLNSEQHRQNLNMRFADFFEFVGTNIVLIFGNSSSVETTHYMSLFHEYFCCSTLFLVGKYHWEFKIHAMAHMLVFYDTTWNKKKRNKIRYIFS